MELAILRPMLLLVAAGCCGAAALGAETAELGCEGEWAASALCVERARALDARAKAEAVLSSLGRVEQPPWQPADLAAASALYDEGVALYRDEYFGDAAGKFEPAVDRLQAIQDEYDVLVDQTTETARDQLAQENFAEALAGFRQLLAWNPADAAARVGAEEAEAGQRVQDVANEATRLIEAGQPERARTLLDGLAADIRPRALRSAQDLLRRFDAQVEHNALIGAGHAALDRRNWVAAEAAFRNALAIDANSVAAKDGLAQVGRYSVEARLATLRETLAAQVAEESWADAVATIGVIARLDAAAPEATAQLPEVQQLDALEKRLDSALADPRRAVARTLRDATRALIETSKDRSRVGKRIHAKGMALEEQLEKWTVPVALTIHSDRNTEIHMRPGRKLGKFRSTDLEVYPGRYTLVARRQGFREKKLSLDVKPGSTPITVELVCDERF